MIQVSVSWFARSCSSAAVPALVSVSSFAQLAPAPAPNTSVTPWKTLPFSLSVLERSRTLVVDFYADPPYRTTYPYVEQLLRISIAQRFKHFDYQLELSENDIFDAPTTSVDPVAARGQLFLGGTYYTANSNNTLPVAASFRQGFLRYRGEGPDTAVRAGRFEFFDGQETTPKNLSLAWLQTNRIAERLLGNLGFSTAQCSFEGIDGHYGKHSWNLTAMAGRPTQGVFNMNANPELNVDIQYLAFTKKQFQDHMLFRVFALGFHDGRTGVVKTDNRALAVRTADHRNIRVGTYGADAIATVPVGPGAFDLLFWGVLQNGQWGALNQHSGAAAVEAGYCLTYLASKPWLRGGFFHGSGDDHPTDDQHNTFFQVLPTPRSYARFPFYNMQNSNDQFVQLLDSPLKKLDIRTDLHFLHLAANSDLWYQGGGAYDNKVFGYTGRPANLHNSFASVYDISSDCALTPSFSLNLYYARSFGKSVINTIYPTGADANFGFLELVYRWDIKQKSAKAK